MKKIKLIIIVAAVFVIGISSLFYVISQKINTEDLKNMIETKIEDSLPGSNVEIKSLNYSLGIQTTINISQLTIESIKPFAGERKLFAVDQVYLTIPFGAILFGGGTIDLEVKSPEILLALKKETSNWSKVIKKETKGSTKKSKEEKSDSELELPSFIANSKVNLRFSDVNLKLVEENKKSSFLIEKVLIKNFGFDTKSAFEIASNLNYALSETEMFKSKILLIGQFDTEAFFSDGHIKSSIVVNVKDIHYMDEVMSIPNIRGELDINLTKEDLLISSDFKGEELFHFNVKALSNKNELKISDLSFGFNLNKIGKYLKNKKLIEKLAFKDSVFEIKGGATLDKNNHNLKPKIVFEIAKPIVFTEQGISISNTLKGDYTNTDFRGSLKSEFLGGLVFTSFNTVLDLNNVDKRKDLLNTLFVNIKGSNVRFTKKKIQNLLYPEKGKVTQQRKDSNTSVVAKNKFPELPKLNLNINLNPIFMDEESLGIKGKMFSRKNEFGSKGIFFNVGSGKGRLLLNGRVSPKLFSSNVDFKMTNLNLSAMNALLPPVISGISGNFNGSIKGKISKGKTLRYYLGYNVTAKDGELKNLNLAGFVGPYINKISLLKDKLKDKDLNMTDRFKLLEAQGRATEKVLDLTRFNFKAKGKSADITANGKVYMTDNGSSRIHAEIKDKSGKLNKALRGVKSLPILLEGQGMNLKPNFAYTTKKIGKKAAETAVKKEVNKVINKNKDKVKKLFKGLFK